MEYSGFYKNCPVLITGGLGFVGSNLAQKLVSLGADVTLMDNFQPGHGANMRNVHGIETKVKVSKSDIRDKDVVEQLVPGKKVIFHIAAQTSHTDSMIDPFLDIDINCRGTMILLEAARRLNPGARIVHVSTRAVYGAPITVPATEETRPNPVDIYGVNKYAGEAYHLIYHRAHGLDAVILRMSNSYGPRAQIEHHKFGILNWFVGLALTNKKIRIFGDGAQLRDYTYIDDMVDALLLAGERAGVAGKTYNVSAGSRIKFIEMVEALIKTAEQGEYELIPWPDEYRKIEVGDFVADSSLITKELGWSPRTPFEDGLRKTVDYYRENLAYYAKS